jgi:hypothetical protein
MNCKTTFHPIFSSNNDVYAKKQASPIRNVGREVQKISSHEDSLQKAVLINVAKTFKQNVELSG